MSKADKTLEKIMGGKGDANISFDDLCHLLLKLGWAVRQSSSHVIFTLGEKLLNIQNRGGKVLPYQVRQVREKLKS
jgi:predicted RNA binding protein YcfA (HicA-like mRNA interferase family)